MKFIKEKERMCDAMRICEELEDIYRGKFKYRV